MRKKWAKDLVVIGTGFRPSGTYRIRTDEGLSPLNFRRLDMSEDWATYAETKAKEALERKRRMKKI